MRKRIISLLLSIFCISMLIYGVDAWIRINQLGYLPNAQKKAILISESHQQSKNQTPFYLPPNEWYNDSISLWCKEVGIQLVNFTPGTLSNADYSIPEMRDKYYSSNEIYNKILNFRKLY